MKLCDYPSYIFCHWPISFDLFFSLNHLKKIFYIYFVSIISILNCLAGLGCSRTFCGAYWTAQGLDARQINVICPEETFKPVWMFVAKILFILFNFFLMEVCLRCSLTERCQIIPLYCLPCEKLKRTKLSIVIHYLKCLS